MSSDSGTLPPDPRVAPIAIAGFGGLLFVGVLLETAVFSRLDPDVILTQSVVVPFLLFLPFVGGLVYGAHVLHQGRLDPERYWRVAGWCGAGTAVMVGFDFVLLAVFPPSTVWILLGGLRLFAGMGAAIGLLVGMIEARAIQTARQSERRALRAETLESRRAWLTYLNGLLRHEVLNSAQVIDGYASAVLERNDLDPETREAMQTIQNQSEDMTSVIEYIRVLIEATRGEERIRPVELTGVLRAEIRSLEETYPTAEVPADLPAAAVPVRADELLPRVFSNLLNHAIERGEGEQYSLSVTVVTTPETVTVRVADDGPPRRSVDATDLSGPTSDVPPETPIALQIANHLLRRYDGDIDVSGAAAGESTVTVTLDRPQVPDADVDRIHEKGRASGSEIVRTPVGTPDGGWDADVGYSADGS